MSEQTKFKNPKVKYAPKGLTKRPVNLKSINTPTLKVEPKDIEKFENRKVNLINKKRYERGPRGRSDKYQGTIKIL